MTAGGRHVLRIWIEDTRARVRIRLSGELDLATVPQLRQVVDAHARHGQTMVIDLRAVEFIDSMGLACLVRARHRALARGARLELVAPGDAVYAVFTLTRLDKLFEWVPAPSAPAS